MKKVMKLKNCIKHHRLSKVMIVLSLGFCLKLFFSCTPPPPIEMYYNSAGVTGIDNSGRYIESYVSIDTMHSEAIALRFTLSDSSLHYYAFTNTSIRSSFSFSSAMALSIDESYIPVNHVEDIKIFTVFDIDSNINAGDDVSPYVLYSAEYNYELYENVDQAISKFNGLQQTAGRSIEMVLKTPVQNTKAQFRIDITLDHGVDLSCVTDTITILAS